MVLKLTETQLDAYAALDEIEGKTARQLKVRTSTLDGLVERGLATRTSVGHGDMLHPRDRHVYRKVTL